MKPRIILQKILKILLFGILYFVANRFVDPLTDFEAISFSYSFALLISFSVIDGPLVGGLSIALGTFLSQVTANRFNWIFIICSFLDCFLVGYSMNYLDIRNGFFESKDITNFNRNQLLSHIACWMIIYPALAYFNFKEPIIPTMGKGFYIAFGYFISCLIVSTLSLDIYSRTRVSEANFYRK